VQSFKATFDAHSDGANIASKSFAPYLATELTRVYVIHNEQSELAKVVRTLSTLAGFWSVGWQTNRNIALKDIIQIRPELIVVYSSCISSLDYALARAIKEEIPTTKLMFVSSELSRDQLKKLLFSGANGFCLASTIDKSLGLALQTVALGGIWIDPRTASEIFDSSVNESETEATAQPLLSDRETEVLHLVAEGMTNQEIALRLWLSRETVKSHVKKIMRKLSVKDRTQAAVAALRLGLSV
jgi:two-component system, NarL family, nitrate/nitrite response regulator NarL